MKSKYESTHRFCSQNTRGVLLVPENTEPSDKMGLLVCINKVRKYWDTYDTAQNEIMIFFSF